jgi:hypothetical protein
MSKSRDRAGTAGPGSPPDGQPSGTAPASAGQPHAASVKSGRPAASKPDEDVLLVPAEAGTGTYSSSVTVWVKSEQYGIVSTHRAYFGLPALDYQCDKADDVYAMYMSHLFCRTKSPLGTVLEVELSKEVRLVNREA